MDVNVTVTNENIEVGFDYNRKLVARMKEITGRQFDATRQKWLIPLYSIEELTERLPIPQRLIDLANSKRELKRETLKKLHLKYDLRNFQYDAVLFLIDRFKAFLCADLGLGKTLMSLAYSETLFNTDFTRRTIIICSASLKKHWADEIKKFIEAPQYQIVSGTKKQRMNCWKKAKDCKYVILNYELVRINDDFMKLNELLRNKSLVVLDEATRIKNFKAQISQKIKQLDAPYKAVLSGRPLENRPEELFSINQFLDNNVLGTWAFYDKRFIVRDSWGSPAHYMNLDELHERLKTIMYRCRIQDVIHELPEKIDHNYYIQLTQSESQDYHQITTRILDALDEYGRTKQRSTMKTVLSNMTMAKMFCDHPDLVRESESRTAKGIFLKTKVATKFSELKSILQEIGDQKVIIFTQYAKMCEKLYNDLKSHYSCVMVTGGDKQRDAKIDEFKGDKQVLICTDVLGYGVNLQFASCVINYDLPWNPAVLDQRNARVYRMGQKNIVNIINLIVEDEDKIEQKIREILGYKKDLYRQIIEGDFSTDEE